MTRSLWLILATVFLTALMGIKIHCWRVDSLKLDFQQEKAQALTKQKAALVASCDADKALTQEVSNVYQNRISRLDHQLSNTRRLLSRSCVAIQGSAGIRHYAAPGSGKPLGSGAKGAAMASGSAAAAAGEGGKDASLPVGSFLDLIGEGERYRLQLMSCQEFIVKTQPASLQPPK